MPEQEYLDGIAKLIANCTFAKLGPEQRAVVIDLAIKAGQLDMLSRIDDSLGDVADYFNRSDYFRK